jgi:hypothetical protein
MIKNKLDNFFFRVIAKRELLFFMFLGLIFLGIPLLKNAHLESAMFSTILASCWILFRKESPRTLLSFQFLSVYTCLIPLLISDGIRGCFSLDGVLFWLVIPFPTLLLVHSIRNLVQNLSLRFLSWILCLVIALGLPIFELKLNPSVYLFNPIWGFWPGPIYDEQITFPFQLLIHRFYVVLWAVLLWEIARKNQSLARIGITFAAISLLFLNFRSLGILRTETDLRKQFSYQIEKNGLILYADSSFTSTEELNYIAEKAAFHLEEIETLFKVSLPEKLHIYVYNHPWQKKKLIGAKYTQFTPVWSSGFQLHIDLESWNEVLRHELVHAVAKSFSNKVIGAPLTMGLTEGLATAVDPSVSEKFTLDEFVASGGIPKFDEMKKLFSFWGFYRQSSANAYYKSGSFLAFVVNNYPIEALKKWHSGDSFESAFDVKIDTVINHWQDFLGKIPVDSNSVKEAKQRFARPALFDKSCPRFMSKGYLLWDKALYFSAEHDSVTFGKIMKSGISLQDSLWSSFFKRQFVFHLLEQGKADSALSLLADSTSSVLLKSDALVLAGRFDENSVLRKEQDSLFQKSSVRKTVQLQKQFCEMYYRHQIPDSILTLPNELLALALDVIVKKRKEQPISPIQARLQDISNYELIAWVEFLLSKNKYREAEEVFTELNTRKLNKETERRSSELQRFGKSLLINVEKR